MTLLTGLYTAFCTFIETFAYYKLRLCRALSDLQTQALFVSSFGLSQSSQFIGSDLVIIAFNPFLWGGQADRKKETSFECILP